LADVLLSAAAWLLAGALLAFAIRRGTLLVAACLPPRSRTTPSDLPSVTLLLPARNEASGIAATLDALDSLDYPPERLFVVLINDGSDDTTGQTLERWAVGRPRTSLLTFDRPCGKRRALNAGISAARPTDLIVVCDADLRPRSDWLMRLAEAFADETVGGAAALLAPVGADRSPVSRYAAVETWVHQLVTSAGKDRLDLNPATNGASAYRRSALEPLGWFGVGFSGDDVSATVGLTRTGWRTRLVQTAVADNPIVHRWRDYWRQHIRWAQNLSAGAPATQTVGNEQTGSVRRLEARVASTGYSDRLVFMAVLALAAHGTLPRWLPGVYLGVLGSQVATALIKARTGWRFFGFFFWTVMFFAIDVLASLAAMVARVTGQPHIPQRAEA